MMRRAKKITIEAGPQHVLALCLAGAVGQIDIKTLAVELPAPEPMPQPSLWGAPSWMKQMIRVVGSVLPIAIRCYDEEAEGEAWTWLKS